MSEAARTAGAEGQGEPLSRRRGQARCCPAPSEVRPLSPAADRYPAPHPRRRHDHRLTVSRPGPGSLRRFRIFGTVLVTPFAATFRGGHRCRPTLAVRRRGVPAAGRLRGPLGRERATTHPAQKHRRGPSRCQRAASAQRPTPTPRPSPRCEGS